MTSIKTFQIISEYGKYKHLKRIPVYPQPGKLDFNIKKKKVSTKSNNAGWEVLGCIDIL